MIISNLMIDKKNKENLNRVQFANDISEGLSASPKSISSKYFYDDKGSLLFQEITRLKEYYPTRTENEILESIKNILPDIIGRGEIDIIELGVGDGHKSKILLESFLNKKIKVNFYPIDISEEAMKLLGQTIPEFPNLKIHGIIAEYIEGLRFARKNSNNRQIVLFLGSNIGNFGRSECRNILKTIRSALKKDDFLLIGFDLKKNIDLMTRAYNDSEGTTAKFNLNLLERINAELGANFHLENFNHLAIYNPELGAMESYLISLTNQDIFIRELNQTFHFEEFEPIHLEYSFKFLEKDIIEMSNQVGFTHITNFKDSHKYFVDSLWKV